MRRILLVKTSSLGDVVHNLPVAADLRSHFPDVEIDWAVEEAFAEVPALHPDVAQVFPVALRRWRRALLRGRTWGEIGTLKDQFRARAYDEVIDTQGLLKSALIARLAPGRRSGLDWSSSREPLRPLYDRTFHVSWSLHAVERNRQLAAQALGYIAGAPVRYGIKPPAGVFAPESVSGSYAVLLHATSAAAKLWPEHQWVKLGDQLHHSGLQAVLPWGSEEEHNRSRHIAGMLKHAAVPPRMSLRAAAGLLASARVVFGVDTGLTHLAVAVGAATVGIYCATDPAATGLYGSDRCINVGGVDGPPPVGAVIAAWHQVQARDSAAAPGISGADAPGTLGADAPGTFGADAP
jgi:heptosyltransferase I